MSDETKKDEQIADVKAESAGEPLSDSQLGQVAGGGKNTKPAEKQKEFLTITMTEVYVSSISTAGDGK
jgi:hypothetical protein